MSSLTPLLLKGTLDSLKPNTRLMYLTAFVRFLRWCRANHFTLPVFSFDMSGSVCAQLDRVVCSYILFLREHSLPYTYASLLLAAMNALFPVLSGRLPFAWRLTSGWDTVRVKNVRRPLPPGVMYAVVARLFIMKRPYFALFLWLHFDVFARISELKKLRLKDVVVVTEGAIGAPPGVYLFLRDTKTRAVDSVRVYSPLLCAALASLVRFRLSSGSSPDSLLFPVSFSNYNAVVRALVRDFLPDFHFTSHCCRHGGVSYAYLLGFPLDDLAFRGRWASRDSLKHYIKAGVSLLLTMQLSESDMSFVRLAISRLWVLFVSGFAVPEAACVPLSFFLP